MSVCALFSNLSENMKRIPLGDLEKDPFDAVVIGAGINGSGAAQQLAARGYRVLIIDKDDFSSGATNRSSRILHCGLRHLAPGKSAWDFVWNPSRFWVACKNARKSMDSRSQIAKTIKPLVSPFPFCFPIYEDGPYAPWQLDAGFKLMEFLGPGDLPLDYTRYTRKNMDKVPFSSWVRDPQKLKGFAVFRDYQFLSADRLVIDTLKDAYRLGAVVRNYTECVGAKRIGDQWELELQDCDDSSETIWIKSKLVLNTSGPWGDKLTGRLTGNSKRRMVGLKGIHILVNLPEELAQWGMMGINSENETIYCLPWKGMRYIGPSRTPYDQDLDSVVCTEKEVDWMLSEVNLMLPKLNLTRNDVHYTYAGIQPVSYDPKDPKGTRQIRIHDLSNEGFPNMLMLTGGPIMTYRIIGSDLADAVAKRIRPSSSVKELSYFPSAITKQVYKKKGGRLMDPEGAGILKEIVAEEQVSSLIDLFFRRSDFGWDLDLGRAKLEPVAKIMAEILGWDDIQLQDQIDRYISHIEENFPSHN
jgi:glycerol-3-phosphate dehydrogenase